MQRERKRILMYINSYLKENLTNDDIIGILEVDGEEDGNAILTLCLDKNALRTTVGDIHQLSNGVASLHGSEDVVEGSGEEVALHKRDRGSQLFCKDAKTKMVRFRRRMTSKIMN
jgi:hypothetical protein